MRCSLSLVLLQIVICFGSATIVCPQDVPQRIGPYVVDVHGTIPRFPDDLQLAESRGLNPRELPGAGLGIHAGAHVYVFTWKAITLGLGGDLTLARAHAGEKRLSTTERTRAVTERFTHVAPELSFNFGDGDGWSYISGGIGPARWSITPDDEIADSTDRDRLRTINYGGGAKWFIRERLAFSFDVRFYAIDPGTPRGSQPGSPRTTLLIMGAGVSFK